MQDHITASSNIENNEEQREGRGLLKRAEPGGSGGRDLGSKIIVLVKSELYSLHSCSGFFMFF